MMNHRNHHHPQAHKTEQKRKQLSKVGSSVVFTQMPTSSINQKERKEKVSGSSKFLSIIENGISRYQTKYGFIGGSVPLGGKKNSSSVEKPSKKL
jgi:hypothetical protein